MRSLLVFALITVISISVPATTIVPFPHLGEMAKASDAVVLAHALSNFTFESGNITRFRTRFKIEQVISGEIEESLVVENMHVRYGEFERIVLGDVYFEEGATYLIFLRKKEDGIWSALMLSHAVFVERKIDDQDLLFPIEDAFNFETINQPVGKETEPLGVFKKEALIALLIGFVKGEKTWNSSGARSSIPMNHADFSRAAPSHCTFLSSSPYPHWPGFPSTPLPVRYHFAGDSGCSSTASKVQSAINVLNNNYSGINLINAGTHNYSPGNCSGGATGDNFVNWVDNNLGGSRNIVIQFNDPCNEIGNLINCSGVLAYGGMYWTSNTHSENGLTWRGAAWGYVVVNNGVGACLCNSGNIYRDMLIHEITHSLGFGHISTSYGQANMNPSNPSSITSLDLACLDFAYPPGSGGGNNCDEIINLTSKSYTKNTEIRASQKITVNSVTVQKNVVLTLIAPVIVLNSNVLSTPESQMVLINQHGCP